jgi:hypothetical protein
MFSKLPTHTKVCSESAPKQIITRKGCGPHLVVCRRAQTTDTPPPHPPTAQTRQRKKAEERVSPPPPLPLCQHHTGSSGWSRSRSRSQESAVMTVQPPTTVRTRGGQCDVWGRRLNASCGCWLRFGSGGRWPRRVGGGEPGFGPCFALRRALFFFEVSTSPYSVNLASLLSCVSVRWVADGRKRLCKSPRLSN